MKSSYKKLGQYIRQVDIRNLQDKRDNLLGVSTKKIFIESIANTVGTDFTKYKLVKKHQFTYVPDTSRRGDKIGIAMLEHLDEALVSQAYTVFEVTDHTKLLPEYLMMWFRREEFDRYARFKSHGSVREIFDWDEMCNVKLPIPSIDVQQNIVDQYNKINSRILLKIEAITNIDRLGLAIYKEWFEDFDFPISESLSLQLNNPKLIGKPYKSSNCEMIYSNVLGKEIPAHFEVFKLKDFCFDMRNGATPKRDILEYWTPPQIKWIKTGEIFNNIIFDSEEKISELGFQNSSTQILPNNTVLMAMYGATAAQLAILKTEATTNQACCAMMCNSLDEASYLYFRLLNQQSEIKNLAIGGAQENLNKDLIENLPILFSKDIVNLIECFGKLIQYKSDLTHELLNLKEFSKKLLSRLAVKY
ncbi:restriction endonuclease subunit S [Acinetobacter variabilis]|uniref:restriction endonuclease subunit S n=1 Tax=Acinetobacter variabilis TaxID=70346 RepID=UPI0028AD83E4|nr:restriction endonuclease subunit S [Acinetobacter variabilis]